MKFQSHSFACECSVFQAPFVEKTTFVCHWMVLAHFGKPLDHICRDLFLGLLLLFLMLIPHSFVYYGSVVSSQTSVSPPASFFFLKIFQLFGVLWDSYEFEKIFFCFYKIMSSEFISDFTNLSSPSFYFLTICVTKSSSNLLIFSKSHLLVVLIFFCFSLFCVTYLCSALLFFYWLCM